jgi:CHAD domain-containing protein
VPETDMTITGGAAVRQILAELLADLVRNEAGAAEGAAIEFLHNYRVAVRRARVIVSQYKNAIPAETAAFLQKELRWLGRATSPLRDADIFMAAIEQYALWLPGDLAQYLKPFREHLLQSRKTGQEKLVRLLTDKRYRAFIAFWRDFAAGDSVLLESEALPDFQDLAHTRIWRLYKKTVRRGQKISPESAPAELHELRKECKKLRYLIELSAKIIPPGKNSGVMKTLKSLQNVLGAHQDCDVQAAAMMDFSRSFKQGSMEAGYASLAMGILIGHLDALKAEQREKFAASFEKFAGGRSRRGYRILCGKN